jgi:DNA-binding NtrC family response regulator
LRLLQERKIERLGGREALSVDVRIIASTNRDLEEAISEGRFREDLYYRLKVVTIWLPPLRERNEDIPLLIDHYMSRYAAELGVDNPGISEEAKETFLRYEWPGNVRELANTIHKALIFNRGAPIQSEDIAQAVSVKEETGNQAEDEPIRGWAREALSGSTEEHIFDLSMNRFASILISEALNLTGGNRSQAAKLLGISRPTLHSKIEKYQLKLETTVKGD